VVVGCVLLEADDASTDKLALVNDVVGLEGEHSLNVVSAITQDKTITLIARWVWRHLLELKTL
jgi:hypothetical protein